MVVAATCLATGCGTVFSGSTQAVSFAVPPDARLSVDGRDLGAQRQVDLARGKDHLVKVERPGCKDGSTVIDRSINGVAIWNLIDPAGWLVDAMTGALWKLDKNVTVPQDCSALSAAPR